MPRLTMMTSTVSEGHIQRHAHMHAQTHKVTHTHAQRHSLGSNVKFAESLTTLQKMTLCHKYDLGESDPNFL